MQSAKNEQYERYRPEPYQKEMSIFWWIRNRAYFLFIVRELSSIFVAAYALILLVKLRALAQGAEAWEALVVSLSSTASVLLHSVILLFVIFHSYTWFKLAPKAMVLKIGKKRVPGSAIIAVNFVMWVVLSIAIGWIILSL